LLFNIFGQNRGSDPPVLFCPLSKVLPGLCLPFKNARAIIHNMKKDILNYFRTDRTYKVGVALYMLYGNRVSFKKQLNIQSETKEMKETLFEELRAIAGIEHKEFQAILKTPVKKVPAGEVSMEEQMDPLGVPGSEGTDLTPEEVQPVIPEEVQPVTEPETAPVIPEEVQPVTEPETAPVIPEEVQPVTEPETAPVIPEEVLPVPEPEPIKAQEPPKQHQKPKRR
jgi:hypothetical protein